MGTVSFSLPAGADPTVARQIASEWGETISGFLPKSVAVFVIVDIVDGSYRLRSAHTAPEFGDFSEPVAKMLGLPWPHLTSPPG